MCVQRSQRPEQEVRGLVPVESGEHPGCAHQERRAREAVLTSVVHPGRNSNGVDANLVERR
jgi:hypothetical protein